MKVKTKIKTLPAAQENLWSSLEQFDPSRTLEWLGGVNHENLRLALKEIKTLLMSEPQSEISMLVNSYGGATGIAMSFFDTIRNIFKVNLTTIGSGDVDSSGVIIFLSGQKRYLTKNTTLLFHLAGRTFGTSKRFSTADLEDILKEDRLKDYQYACVVSDATEGRYSPEKVLEMMKKNTVLTADEAVSLGLAHKVL